MANIHQADSLDALRPPRYKKSKSGLLKQAWHKREDGRERDNADKDGPGDAYYTVLLF